MAVGETPVDEQEALLQAQEILAHLEDISFVAHRDAKAAMPAVEPYGPQAVLDWLEAARELFFHDRDAGKAFIRNTPAVAEAAGGTAPWLAQAREFARWRGSWKALEGFMEQAAEVFAEWGEAGEQTWFTIGHAWLERHLDSGSAYFTTPFRELGGDEGPAAIEALMAPAEELFQQRRLALGSYLEGALKVRGLIGVEGVRDWARRGADILQAGRQRGEAYFRLESDESRALLLESAPGTSTRENTRLFQLLARGWFGEDLLVEDSGWHPGEPLLAAETDGARLFLPAVLPDAESAILAVEHVTGHLVFGSYDQDAIQTLFERQGLAHPPVDDQRRITWLPLFAPFGDDMVRFGLLFDLCEDLRVDARIDGVIPNYRRRLLRRADVVAPPQGATGAWYGLARTALASGLAATGAGRDAGQTDPVDPASLPAAVWARLTPLLDPAATLVDAFETALSLYHEPPDGWSAPAITLEERPAAYLPGHAPNAARPVYPRVPAEAAEDDGLDRAATEEEREKSCEECKEETPDEGSGDPDLDIAPEETSGTGGRIGVGIPQPAQVVGRGLRREANRDGFPYPEWDYRENAYKRDWARVRERALEEGDEADIAPLMARHANTLKRLRRALQLQRPQRPAPLRRQYDGDELDLEAAMEYVTEKRLGRSPRDHVYKRRAVQHRDTAVLLLADISTSIMANASDGEGTVVERLRAGMLIFAEALREVGDPFAIAGFASKNRDQVSYYPIKAFDDGLDAHVRARIAGLSGRLATRMGAAIRHATAKFSDSPARRRLLLILSDGRPADYDDGGDPRYLHEDTRMAVKEAVDAGVHPFCITLDPAGDEYLPAIFGPGHFMVLDHVDELPRRLPEIYLRLRK